MQGLLIRLDDITPDMDWDRFDQLKKIFDRYQIHPLLGIVPENQDPKLHKQEARENFWQVMLDLHQSGWMLSQHGYRHIYVNHQGGLLKLNKNSEFAGLSLEEQKEKLLKGREILAAHGIQTNIFMAPSHSYDKDTIKALKQTGFQFVTDGYGCRPYSYKGIGFVPCTLTRYQVRNGIDTICIHANTMTTQMLEQLESDIKKHRESFIEWNTVLDRIPPKNLAISLSEQKELSKRKIKAFVGGSEVFQEYLQRTNSGNRYQKLGRRILFFPVTLCRAWKASKKTTE